MRLIPIIAATALLGSVGTFALAQTQPMTPQDFATTAASSDMFEIQSSEIALEKAQSDQVKEFAQQMIDDHTKASEELKAAAEQDGASLPGELLETHQVQLDQLGNASDDGFDAAYIQAQVLAHEEAIALMTDYAENGEDGALKAHAQKTAPIIQTHLEHVQQLAPQ